MPLIKHILIDNDLLEILERNKIHKRETYNDVIKRLIKKEEFIENG